MALPNILVISNYSGPLAAIRPEAEIFIGLLKHGFQITFITPSETEYANRFIALGAEVIDHKPASKMDLKTIKLIRETVGRKSTGIVHAFNSKAISNAAIALWGKRTKLVGYRGYTGNIHWYDPSCYVAYLNPRVNYMVCLAESVRQMFIANGMPARKAITIHKGHDPRWYADVKPADLTNLGITPETLTCAFVANNRTRMKGLHHLVNASCHLPTEMSIRFLLIGSGMDTSEILKLIAQTPRPERFVFMGFRPDAMCLVKACDIAISASLFGEATQKAMIEALFMGKPVVITDIPGNAGMVVDGEGGYVVQPGNEKQIADALIKLHQNRDSLAAMGEKARAHIAQFLSAERTVNAYARFYERIRG